MISVICVYNDKEILDKFLLKSLKPQTVNYELILLDNTQKKFKSAAEALNYGGEKAKGEYIMFVHQDIDLLFKTWLDDTEKILGSLKNLGVAGVAGVSEIKDKTIFSNIKNNIPPEPVGIRIKKSKKVQTVDECLILVPRSIFKKIKFDEKNCPNWHLYAVDYCLTVKRINKSVYVIPSELHHASEANSFSKDYYSTIKKISKKHGLYFNKINTTSGAWSTNKIKIQIEICQHWIQRIITNFIKIFIKPHLD